MPRQHLPRQLLRRERKVLPLLLPRRSRGRPRRRLFLMVVGDEFKTGEGTQAFAVLADLVVHPHDATSYDRLVAHTVGERRRLYKTGSTRIRVGKS